MKRMRLGEQVAQIKEEYPIGTKLKLIAMKYPQPTVPSGAVGEVVYIDNIGTLKIQWDNGRTFGIVVTDDKFEVMSKPK